MSDEKKVSFFGKIKKFFRELRSEVKKIVWPSRKQVVNNTGIVIACVLGVGVIIWVLDFAFRFVISILA